jgi:hypothetical protein
MNVILYRQYSVTLAPLIPHHQWRGLNPLVSEFCSQLDDARTHRIHCHSRRCGRRQLLERAASWFVDRGERQMERFERLLHRRFLGASWATLSFPVPVAEKMLFHCLTASYHVFVHIDYFRSDWLVGVEVLLQVSGTRTIVASAPSTTAIM